MEKEPNFNSEKLKEDDGRLSESLKKDIADRLRLLDTQLQSLEALEQETRKKVYKALKDSKSFRLDSALVTRVLHPDFQKRGIKGVLSQNIQERNPKVIDELVQSLTPDLKKLDRETKSYASLYANTQSMIVAHIKSAHPGRGAELSANSGFIKKIMSSSEEEILKGNLIIPREVEKTPKKKAAEEVTAIPSQKRKVEKSSKSEELGKTHAKQLSLILNRYLDQVKEVGGSDKTSKEKKIKFDELRKETKTNLEEFLKRVNGGKPRAIPEEFFKVDRIVAEYLKAKSKPEGQEEKPSPLMYKEISEEEMEEYLKEFSTGEPEEELDLNKITLELSDEQKSKIEPILQKARTQLSGSEKYIGANAEEGNPEAKKEILAKQESLRNELAQALSSEANKISPDSEGIRYILEKASQTQNVGEVVEGLKSLESLELSREKVEEPKELPQEEKVIERAPEKEEISKVSLEEGAFTEEAPGELAAEKTPEEAVSKELPDEKAGRMVKIPRRGRGYLSQNRVDELEAVDLNRAFLRDLGKEEGQRYLQKKKMDRVGLTDTKAQAPESVSEKTPKIKEKIDFSVGKEGSEELKDLSKEEQTYLSALEGEFFNRMLEENPGFKMEEEGSKERLMSSFEAYQAVDKAAKKLIQYGEETVLKVAGLQTPSEIQEAVKASLEKTAFHNPEFIKDLDSVISEVKASASRILEKEQELEKLKESIIGLKTEKEEFENKETASGNAKASRDPYWLKPGRAFLFGMKEGLKDSWNEEKGFFGNIKELFDVALREGKKAYKENRFDGTGGARGRLDELNKMIAKSEDNIALLEAKKAQLENMNKLLFSTVGPLKMVFGYAKAQAQEKIKKMMQSPSLKDLEEAYEYSQKLKSQETVDFFSPSEDKEVWDTAERTKIGKLKSKKSLPTREGSAIESYEDVQSELNFLIQAQLNTDLDKAMKVLLQSGNRKQLTDLLRRALNKDGLGSKDKAETKQFIKRILEMKLHDFDETDPKQREKKQFLLAWGKNFISPDFAKKVS